MEQPVSEKFKYMQNWYYRIGIVLTLSGVSVISAGVSVLGWVVMSIGMILMAFVIYREVKILNNREKRNP